MKQQGEDDKRSLQDRREIVRDGGDVHHEAQVRKDGGVQLLLSYPSALDFNPEILS